MTKPQQQAPAIGKTKLVMAEETIYPFYNVNGSVQAQNFSDKEGNPEGGYVIGVGMDIHWQSGPRAIDGSTELKSPNGAFVEDVIYAALQRLQYFQDSKYRCRENAIAISKLEEALAALKNRQLERTLRDVEGKHEV